MEMCETDLSKLIPKRLTQKEIYNIMIDLTSGLRYMQAISKSVVTQTSFIGISNPKTS